MTDARDHDKLAEVLDGFPIAMVVTIDADGRPLAQPLAMQQQHHAFDGDLWFLTTVDSSTAQRVAEQPLVNLALSSRDSWASITGHAELAAERHYIDAMWDSSVEAWFPDGRDDPRLRALIVHADSAEYWDTPGAAVASVISFVKAKVTGEPMEIDTGKVEL